jgi:hypothetical protein
VGGSGSWDDPEHWSIDATSSRTYPGNGCVPTLYDDVVFDQYSGSDDWTVTTTAPSYCNNMTWLPTIGTPTLTSTGEYPIDIYGSLELNNTVRLGASVFYFCSNRPAETIRSNGNTYATGIHFLFFSKSPGDLCHWKLLDDLSMGNNGEITLGRGYLSTNGKNVTGGRLDDDGYFYTIHHSSYLAAGDRGLNIANSTIQLYSGWRYNSSSSVRLISDSTVNSTIKITNATYRYNSTTTSLPNDFMGYAGDVYYNLEFTPTSVNPMYNPYYDPNNIIAPYNQTGPANAYYHIIEN